MRKAVLWGKPNEGDSPSNTEAWGFGLENSTNRNSVIRHGDVMASKTTKKGTCMWKLAVLCGVLGLASAIDGAPTTAVSETAIALDTRYRSWDWSNASRLMTTKYRGFVLVIR